MGRGGNIFTSRILKTINGGTSWDTVYSINTLYNVLSGIYAMNSDTAYFVGIDATSPTGIILKTTNGGVYWENQYSGINGVLNRVYFSSPNKGYICGNLLQSGGLILKTINTLKITTTNPNQSTIPESFKLQQNYPNPFNPVTNIKYDIPKDEIVKITLFDIQGK